jgi:multidrug resistance efflux pump
MLSERRPAASEPPEAAAPTVPLVAPGSPRRQGGRDLGERVQSLSLSRMPERRSALVVNLAWGAALIAVMFGGWYAYSAWSAAQVAGTEQPEPPAIMSAEGAQPNAAASKQRVLRVDPNAPSGAAPMAPQAGAVALESKGYIVPAHQILVSPKVSGMILQLHVEEGRRVAKGDVLAVLESTDYEADLARAKASVRLAREQLLELTNGNRREEIQKTAAELQEAQAQLVQLEADFRRSEDLRKRSSVTQQELELALSKFLAQKQHVEALTLAHKLMEIGPRPERIEAAKAQVALAEAEVAKAEWRLGNCTIRAPIAGTILKKNAEEGNIVNPIAFNGSFSLCDMADLADLEVDLDIQERDIAAIRVGQKCRVRVDAYPNRNYSGVVDRLMPIADRAKGAISVRVKVAIPADEEGVYLKPEMSAIVTFLNDAAAPVAAATGPSTAN